MTAIRYTNVQRFCLDDGPGVRTTLFLFGCNLRCPWCCNPENVRELPGFPVLEAEPDELARELLRDRVFFGEGGGVTLSGGEPLLQAEALVPLLRLLKDEGVHVAVETALFVEWEKVEVVLPNVDLFLVDAKIMDEVRCRDVVGGDLSRYIFNLGALDSRQFQIRMPLIDPYTTAERNIDAVAALARELRKGSVSVLPGHALADSKLNRAYRKGEWRAPTRLAIDHAVALLADLSSVVEVN